MKVFVAGASGAAGLLVGFRPHGGALGWLVAVELLLLFSFAISWVGVTMGVVVRSREAVQNLAMTLVFPLTFLSSAFVPTRIMPAVLQIFADRQPMTQVVDTIRSLALGLPVDSHGWQALAWCLGMVAVSAPLAMRAYGGSSTR